MEILTFLVTDGISGAPQRSKKCVIVDRLGILTYFVV